MGCATSGTVPNKHVSNTLRQFSMTDTLALGDIVSGLYSSKLGGGDGLSIVT
jgi:hypothetical protein